MPIRSGLVSDVIALPLPRARVGWRRGNLAEPDVRATLGLCSAWRLVAPMGRLPDLPSRKSQDRRMSDAEKRTFTDDEALAFHRYPTPGKIAVVATKPMATQRDLSLAYSPGVAVPVLAIADDPDLAYDYTSKGNLVAVISNGTAILGLGDLGALASKPVMEGKSVLFKRFADVDSIDIEVVSPRPRRDHHRGQEHRRHLRRHQSGGHQEPRVLPHRDRAAGAARHPGVPRRPARHGDHLGGRPDQRLRHHRPQARGHQAGAERRRRGGHRHARPDQGDGRAGRRTASRSTPRASSTAAAPRR